MRLHISYLKITVTVEIVFQDAGKNSDIYKWET